MNPELFERKVNKWFTEALILLNKPIKKREHVGFQEFFSSYLPKYEGVELDNLWNDFNELTGIAIVHDDSNEIYSEFRQRKSNKNNALKNEFLKYLEKDSLQSVLMRYNLKYRQDLRLSWIDSEVLNTTSHSHAMLMSIPQNLYSIYFLVHSDETLAKSFWDEDNMSQFTRNIGYISKYVDLVNQIQKITSF